MAVDALTAFLEDSQGRLSRREPIRHRAVIWALGDSLTAGTASGVFGLAPGDTIPTPPGLQQPCLVYGAGSWEAWALLASDARWTFGGVYATPGFTPAQMMAQFIPGLLAAASPGDTVVILAGTNGASTDVPGTLADIESLHFACYEAGLYTVACTIPPNDFFPTSVNALNAGIRKFAADNGIPLVDLHGALTDPTTGHYASAFFGEGTHPNQAGYKAMGELISATLNPTFQPVVAVNDNQAGLTGYLGTAHPLAIGATVGIGGDIVPFVSLGTSTVVFGAVAGFYGGNAYTLTRNDTDITAAMQEVTLVPGHRYRFGFAYSGTTPAGANINLTLENDDFEKVFGLVALETSSTAIGRFYVDFTLPSNMMTYGFRPPKFVVSGASGTIVNIGELLLVDLTVAGLA